MSTIAFQSSIGLIAVNATREFFSTHKLTQNHRFSRDPDKRRLEIVEQWPESPQVFPLMVIDVSYGSETERYMSDGAGKMLVNDVQEGAMLGGMDNFDVRWTINAHSKTAVNDIADILLFGMKRHIEQSIWEASLFNLMPQRNTRTAGEGARSYTDRELVYFVTYSQTIKSHWHDEVIYDREILTYLATAEREKLSGVGTDTFQIQAGSD